MSDTQVVPEGTALLSPEAMGTFDENGVYIPRSVTEDDLGGASLEDAMAGTIVEFEDGDLVEGTVVKIDRDEVLLDIGFKSEGVIPVRELSIRNDVDPSEIVTLGEAIEALVLQKEDKEGRLILSKKRAQYERAWGTIEKLKEADEVVTGPVIEVVKGGLIVDIGLRGFLPASLVELRRVRELQPYVGRTIEAKIIELDRNRNNVVLSRRAWLEETQKEQRGEFLVNLKPGERRKGVVSSVVNFGAFVDLGGMDGLVHVSELSWKHVDHPSSVVAVGDEIDVEVLDVDLAKERISLSLKATQTDPVAGVRQLPPGRASWSTAGSPSWCPSAPSSRWATASRAWCTSRRWPATTSTCPSRWSPPARSCGSRSSTSTSSVAGSACRSSRPPRVARSPRSTARRSASTPTTTRATTSARSIRRGRVHPRDRGPGGLGRLRRRARHRRGCPGRCPDGAPGRRRSRGRCSRCRRTGRRGSGSRGRRHRGSASGAGPAPGPRPAAAEPAEAAPAAEPAAEPRPSRPVAATAAAGGGRRARKPHRTASRVRLPSGIGSRPRAR